MLRFAIGSVFVSRASAADFSLAEGKNAVPTGEPTVEVDASACQARCMGECTQFSWNSHSGHCFLSNSAAWSPLDNARVTSGCDLERVDGCPTSPPAPPSPPVSHDWVFQTSSSIGYVHMSTIEPLPSGRLLVAFQAAEKTEGGDDQTIFFKHSDDQGQTWSAHKVIISAAQAVWGPCLRYDEATKTLWLFYSESVPANRRSGGRSYPGGDVKYVTSTDGGATWSAATTILLFDDPTRGGPISKVTANKPIVLRSGRWMLPFWQEPHTSNETGTACAGVLVSDDAGANWTSRGCLHSSEAGWLIENTVVERVHNPLGAVLQLFRTREGHVWQSESEDGGETWSEAISTSLLNPNSKTFAMTASTGDTVYAYNPSSGKRTPLALACSADDGKTWNDISVTLDQGGVQNFAYPTSAEFNGTIFTTYSASIHDGIKITMTPTPSNCAQQQLVI